MSESEIDTVENTKGVTSDKAIACNSQFIGFEPGKQLQRHIKHELEKLSRFFKRFPPDGVHLHIVMSMATGRKNSFEVKLTLKIPSHVLHAEKSDYGAISAFSEACEALEREVTKTASLKRNHRHENLKSFTE